jgi:hypothetical protein
LVVSRFFDETLVVTLAERPYVVGSLRGEGNVLNVGLGNKVIF